MDHKNRQHTGTYTIKVSVTIVRVLTKSWVEKSEASFTFASSDHLFLHTIKYISIEIELAVKQHHKIVQYLLEVIHVIKYNSGNCSPYHNCNHQHLD
jgi:hypothetical protein